MSSVRTAVDAAAEAAPAYAAMTAHERRDLLEAVADALAARADDILAVGTAETGLPEPRLRGELDRTTGQLRLLGSYAAEPSGRISAGAAAGNADIVTRAVPVGPVAVFAASNFPLAFGVPGGDTAAALAAGCPVVVKAHPAQPRTGSLLGAILTKALPTGVFHLVQGGAEVSLDLVRAAGIKAVGFTGSLAGGRALLDAAAARRDPIPVYAEMGSLNPVVVLTGAASPENADRIAAAVTGSSGQLCTKPGLVITGSEAFAATVATSVAAATTHRMLTPAMAAAHSDWLGRAGKLGRVHALEDQGAAGSASPVPFAVVVRTDEVDGELLEEHFGPSVVIAVGAAPPLLDRIEGTLTSTVFAADSADDLRAATELLPHLTRHAGRVVWNGVPTGVAVCSAMHHGGPWPATSAPWSTSVGTVAVERFRRPVAFQGVPRDVLATLAW